MCLELVLAPLLLLLLLLLCSRSSCTCTGFPRQLGGGRVKEYMYIDVHVPKVTPQLMYMYMHVVLLCMYINNQI